MTISNTPSVQSFISNGGTTYTYNFAFNADYSQMHMEVDDIIIDPANFSVTQNTDWRSGGYVTYPISGEPLAPGQHVVLRRYTTRQQEFEFTNQETGWRSVMEDCVDVITMEIQETSYVDTNDLVNGSVTEPKMADNSVSTRAVIDRNITSIKINFSTISTDPQAVSFIGADQVINNSLTGNKFVPKTIPNIALGDGVVDSRVLGANPINGIYVSAGTLPPTAIKDSVPLTKGGTGGTDAASGRAGLGLGTVATYNVGSGPLSAIVTDNQGRLPPVSGALLTNLPGPTTVPVPIAQGGTNATTVAAARDNLGLGNAALLSAGVAPGNAVKLEGTGSVGMLPAVDGSNLTNLLGGLTIPVPVNKGGTGAANETTARTNLGLGSAATLTAGTLTGNAVQLIGTAGQPGKLPALDGSNLTNLPNPFPLPLTIDKGGTGSATAATARSALGLGTAATQNVGQLGGNVVQLTSEAKLPPLDGSLLTHLPSNIPLPVSTNNGGTGSAGDLALARSNLGVKSIATYLNTYNDGISAPQLKAVVTDNQGRLPALDGSLLTNLPGNIPLPVSIANGGTGSTTASAARTALGLGSAATLTAGTLTGNAVQLIGTAGQPGKLPALDGSNLTNLPSNIPLPVSVPNGGTGATDAPGARTALGLGTAALLDTSTLTGGVVQLTGTAGQTGKLPAIDGFALTNLNGGQVAPASLPWSAISATSPLGITRGGTNAITVENARINLGLGTAATKNFGVMGGQVVTLSGASNEFGKMPAVDGSALLNLPAPPGSVFPGAISGFLPTNMVSPTSLQPAIITITPGAAADSTASVFIKTGANLTWRGDTGGVQANGYDASLFAGGSFGLKVYDSIHFFILYGAGIAPVSIASLNLAPTLFGSYTNYRRIFSAVAYDGGFGPYPRQVKGVEIHGGALCLFNPSPRALAVNIKDFYNRKDVEIPMLVPLDPYFEVYPRVLAQMSDTVLGTPSTSIDLYSKNLSNPLAFSSTIEPPIVGSLFDWWSILSENNAHIANSFGGSFITQRGANPTRESPSNTGCIIARNYAVTSSSAPGQLIFFIDRYIDFRRS